MNHLIRLKTTAPPLLMTLALLCLGLLPKAQAVSPAPDGGYPGGNTAEGQLALGSLNTSAGLYNTAVGVYSLLSLSDGDFCTGVGAGTLLANTGDQNTATGAGALFSNTTGTQNAANGAFVLFGNTEGNFNTANGVQALFSNTTGNSNTAIGNGALFNNIDGDQNTAIGLGALFSNATGTGNQNTAIGFEALFFSTTGNNNIALGHGAGNGVTTASNVICIGNPGANVSDSCFIGNIFGLTSSGGTAVFINSDGKLGTTTSSRRFKEEIQAMEQASEALFALKPVTFRYKKAIDPQGVPQFGLVAEDVEKVNPDLVVRDKEGKVNTVRYEAVNAMLLNEFLKEHDQVQDLKAIVAEQQKQIEALTAGFQKVSAHLETRKTSPQMALNDE